METITASEVMEKMFNAKNRDEAHAANVEICSATLEECRKDVPNLTMKQWLLQSANGVQNMCITFAILKQSETEDCLRVFTYFENYNEYLNLNYVESNLVN